MADQVAASTNGKGKKVSLLAPTSSTAQPANSSLGVPAATNAKTGRQKKGLLPGKSLMDWIRLTNSGEPMTNLRQMRGITPAELAKHNTEEDCWMSINDQVYDVTRYLEFHPGGVDELMRGAGQDATALFNEVHRWVNYSSMLSKCLVGPLVIPRETVRRRRTIHVDHQTPTQAKPLSAMPPPPSLLSTADRPRWDWTDAEDALTLIVHYPDPVPHSHYASLSFRDGRIKLHTSVPPRAHNFHFNMHSGLKWTPGQLPQIDGNDCRLILHKREPGARVPTIGQVVRDEWKQAKDMPLAFHKCHVVSRSEVTHDTLLFGLEWPEGFFIPVPLGHHVRCRVPIEGMELARSYTPVCSSLVEPELTPDELGGRHFYLMVKIYPDGCLTPHLAEHQPDSVLTVSSPEGRFSSTLAGYRQCQRLLLVAAGTGFTPMARLMRVALHSDEGPPREPPVTVRLLFFNKRQIDIMWRDQLDALQKRFLDRFSVVHVLSQAEDDWTGPRGRVSAELLQEQVPEAGDSDALATMFACVCGPDPFTDSVVELLSTTLKLADSQVHAFKG